ncbi:hypothetical protein SSPO_089610 [Streptomyces antimycoticus]|uniref:Uncharacterized protein n=1 Tax=Streptomyces antimycoticus TaxID=68175 RepID=A0A499UW24_9ACTN|nr:hypothetical protein SSPO_089610 [Streptomyces antimycoticus]
MAAGDPQGQALTRTPPKTAPLDNAPWMGCPGGGGLSGRKTSAAAQPSAASAKVRPARRPGTAICGVAESAE